MGKQKLTISNLQHAIFYMNILKHTAEINKKVKNIYICSIITKNWQHKLHQGNDEPRFKVTKILKYRYASIDYLLPEISIKIERRESKLWMRDEKIALPAPPEQPLSPLSWKNCPHRRGVKESGGWSRKGRGERRRKERRNRVKEVKESGLSGEGRGGCRPNVKVRRWWLKWSKLGLLLLSNISTRQVQFGSKPN